MALVTRYWSESKLASIFLRRNNCRKLLNTSMKLECANADDAVFIIISKAQKRTKIPPDFTSLMYRHVASKAKNAHPPPLNPVARLFPGGCHIMFSSQGFYKYVYVQNNLKQTLNHSTNCFLCDALLCLYGSFIKI